MTRFGFGGDAPAMKPEEFRLLRDLFSARIGLNYGPESMVTLGRRLRERLAILKLATFTEYYQHLRFHPLAHAEWDEAVELLTTNETYFCREDFQLRAFRDELLPLLAESNRARRRLAVWSAGCSTGEEAYTIAILLHHSGLFDGWDVRVLGSDISKRCVTAARRGIYRDSSFRSMPDEMRQHYFKERPEGAHVVDRIRDLCHFAQLNLLDEDKARLLGRVDVIFCRNVFIYFDSHARRRVITAFHERLHPGGILLLGHSESLLNVSTAFELLHLKEDLVYRKPGARFQDPISGTRS
ncbi:MAG: protein-glutamate O-methyltransferase CheR [Polyangiaceae bacterium]